jgi:hypothetical protein
LALRSGRERLALHESLLAVAAPRLLVARTEAADRGALRRVRASPGRERLGGARVSNGVTVVTGYQLAVGTSVVVKDHFYIVRHEYGPTGFAFDRRSTCTGYRQW